MIVSVVRIVIASHALNSWDWTWDWCTFGYFSSIELNVAITCACLMTLRPFGKRFMPTVFWRSTKDSSGPAQQDPSWQPPPTIGGGSRNRPRGGDDDEITLTALDPTTFLHDRPSKVSLSSADTKFLEVDQQPERMV